MALGRFGLAESKFHRSSACLHYRNNFFVVPFPAVALRDIALEFLLDHQSFPSLPTRQPDPLDDFATSPAPRGSAAPPGNFSKIN
jgi:hypothetical protein